MDIQFSKKFLSRYSIGSTLGAGSMGVVYKGRDLSLNREVAIKVLHSQLMDKESQSRFNEEARVCAALKHENITTLYEASMDGDIPYLIFEFINGPSLRSELKRKKDFPLAETLELSLQISNALHYAHERGIVHRDIKPDNILLTSLGTPKVSDFGIARASSERSCKTKTGLILGTVNYMAPEQITNSIPGPSIDIYALGIVMYELFSGNVPFQGETIEVASAILREEPRALTELNPDVPVSLAALIHRCIEKEPSKRFLTAADLSQGLLELIAQFSREARLPSIFQHPDSGNTSAGNRQSTMTSSSGGRQSSAGGKQPSMRRSSAGGKQPSMSRSSAGGKQPSMRRSSAGGKQPSMRRSSTDRKPSSPGHSSAGGTPPSLRRSSAGDKHTLLQSSVPGNVSTSESLSILERIFEPDKIVVRSVALILVLVIFGGGAIFMAYKWSQSVSMMKGPDISSNDSGAVVFEWQTSVPVMSVGEVRRDSEPLEGEESVYRIESQTNRFQKAENHKLVTSLIEEGSYQFRAILGQEKKGEWVSFRSKSQGAPVLNSVEWQSTDKIIFTYKNSCNLTNGVVRFKNPADVGSQDEMAKVEDLERGRGAVSSISYENMSNFHRPLTASIDASWNTLFPKSGEIHMIQKYDCFSTVLLKTASDLGMRDRLTPLFAEGTKARRTTMIKNIVDRYSDGKEQGYLSLIQLFTANSKKFFNNSEVSLKRQLELYKTLIPFFYFEKMATDNLIPVKHYATKALNACASVLKNPGGGAGDNEVQLIKNDVSIKVQSALIKDFSPVDDALVPLNDILLNDEIVYSEGVKPLDYYLGIQVNIRDENLFLRLKINNSLKLFIFRETNNFSPPNSIGKGYRSLMIRLPQGLIKMKSGNQITLEVENWPWLQVDAKEAVNVRLLNLYMIPVK